ncbi:BppU family phage baseplate upper protein [uncultured Senegalimassilia sp.]|uniref:BppU family phage baseplate upper protein n=1 Tax=uncultured Senegalimassilia sp. TaxID=1714350 RepID=UPI0025EF84FF|nr:BppU family phage baseplate upper protein [uncultured Senegalimassilia sp.]
MATHEITLNLKKTNIAPPVITVHQGDSAEVLKAAIYDGDKKAALTGCKVHLMAAKPDHTYVEQQFTGISDNVATVTVNPAAFGVAGLLKVCYVRVRDAAGLDATTENILVNVLPSASAAGTVSGPYVDAVEAIVADLRSQLADVTALNTQMQKAEASRAAAEKQRATNETVRKTAESGRVEAEKGRVIAESARATEAAQLKTASQAATAAANGAASNANAAANTALQIANSVAQGSAGSSDMAKQKQQIADLYGKLADATDAFIYDDGTVYCPASKASASGSTVTFGSTCTASGTTLTLK